MELVVGWKEKALSGILPFKLPLELSFATADTCLNEWNFATCHFSGVLPLEWSFVNADTCLNEWNFAIQVAT